MPAANIALIAVALLCPFEAAAAQDANEEFFAAARRGAAATVKALLDNGVDVNSKTRYGATALAYACDKGHVEVVKLLIERGADVNVRDTFYGETPIGWASAKGHTEIVKLLLDKGARGVDRVLMAGVNSGNAGMVKLVLDKGGVIPQTLTLALSRATRENRSEIVELLKKAGALPPPPADFKVDEETLKSYAGVYKSAAMELTFTLKDGKLMGGPTGQNQNTFGAIDKATFRPLELDGVTITFTVEGGKVIGLTLKQGEQSMVFQRAEQK